MPTGTYFLQTIKSKPVIMNLLSQPAQKIQGGGGDYGWIDDVLDTF